MNHPQPQFTITVAFPNARDTYEVTADGYRDALKRAGFERERFPEATVTITPSW